MFDVPLSWWKVGLVAAGLLAVGYACPQACWDEFLHPPLSPCELRRAKVCGTFCGEPWEVTRDQKYGYWCTCRDGRQKEVF